MERYFCRDKKDYCDILNCKSCEFAKGHGVIDGVYANDVLTTLFGESYNLAHLKQIIEADREGRFVVSPCKVGDRLYTIRTIQDGSFTLEIHDAGEIRQISVNTNGTFFLVDYGHSLSANNFGKTVFKTREAAESALKAVKERENGFENTGK